MKFLANISINKKLVLMQLVTFLVVIVFCAGTYLYVEYKSMLGHKAKNLTSIAQVLATNSQAPILFNDNQAADDILNDLKVEQTVVSAAIIDQNKKVLGKYDRLGEQPYVFDNVPEVSNSSHFVKDKIYIYYDVVQDKEKIGTVCILSEITDVKSQFFDKARLASLVIVIGFFIALFLSSFLQRYISHPLIKLLGVIENIIKTMNYSLRSDYKGKDEIAKLSEAFNKMIEQIEQHEHKLSETNNLLESKVEERTHELRVKNEKLFEANQTAEQSKKVKEQFLATMSHEIRTPLNAILGFQELLKDTPLNAEQKEYLESIDYAGKNLLAIINDILDLSKIEAGKFDFSEDEINIKQILKSALELISIRAKEKNIKLILEHDPEIPILLVGDSARFNQILLNLLGNAIKFTEQGSITITSKLLDSNKETALCEFKVIDTGIGIPKEKIKTIFERFTQASSDTTRKYGGTGLGLTIVQQLLELQGGGIEVESEVGKGSTFKFYLRFKQASSSVFEKNISEVSNSEIINLDYNKKLHILLAEDTPLNQRLVSKVLQKWGYDLDIANNGLEALNKLKTNSYDLVLMDIQMPEMDGYTASQEIRILSDEVKRKTPIIALTAHASKEEAERCLAIGMNAYVTKPFNTEFLRNLILQLTSTKTIDVKPIPVTPDFDKSELYDLSYLIEHAAGDTSFLKEMITEFLNETPNQLSALNSDIKEEDFKKIKFTSHSMKGLFLTLGMNKAAKLLKEIETFAENQSSFDTIVQNYGEIETIFNKSKSLLEMELVKLK